MLQTIPFDFCIEKCCVPPSYSMKHFHYHLVHELFYLESGNCTIYINDSIYKVTSGTVIIIPAGSNHKTTYLSVISNIRYILYFTDKDFENFRSQLTNDDIEKFFNKNVISIPKKRLGFVNELFTKISYEFCGIDEISQSIANIYFLELMFFLIRCQKYSSNVIPKMNTSNVIIQQIIEYILEHYNNDITLSSVALKFNMSESSLSKKFKNFTGFRFKEYLINVRIAAAKNYLINTDMTITNIANLCGFNESNSFGDTFKRITGESPRDFRKKL